MIEDAPMRVLEAIGQGRRSPVLPIQVEDENKNNTKSRTRFAFVRMEDGTVDVVFYSVQNKAVHECSETTASSPVQICMCTIRAVPNIITYAKGRAYRSLFIVCQSLLFSGHFRAA